MTAPIVDKGLSAVEEDQVTERSAENLAGVHTAIGCSLLVVAVLGIYWRTAWSILDIWLRSETFTHGFLIVPIVVWLIWQKRTGLRALPSKPNYWILTVLLGSGFLWLLAVLVDVLVVQQLSMVAIIVAAIWLYLGNQLSLTIAFPLAFLFFAVPLGEGLVPFLMEYTATFTVALVKLTGIPVYREGLLFTLPSGSWSVVAACSGVRYLIASVTLGCLFAYLNYQSLSKRILFILASILVPVLANGLRAYIIVMIGHLSDMRLATGVDHLLYGWLFFGLVMLILFAIGSIWRESEPAGSGEWTGHMKIFTEAESHSGTLAGKNAWANRLQTRTIVVVLLATLVWPLLAYAIERSQWLSTDGQLKPPSVSRGWQLLAQRAWNWQPVSVGASQELLQFYQMEGRPVSLYLGQYLVQKQGAELINSENRLVNGEEKRWRVKDLRNLPNTTNIGSLTVRQFRISGPGADLLVWSWYRVGSRYTTNPYIAKIYEAIAKLTFSRQDSAWIVLATPFGKVIENGIESEAEKTLTRFVEDMQEQVAIQLDRSAGVMRDK